jgi:hypothetical protein
MKNWLTPGEIPLKGFKIREIGLKENDFRLLLENRRGERATLVLHGLVAFRDRGANGKTLRGIRLEDLGHLKKLIVAAPGKGEILECECMEAELARFSGGKGAAA